MDGGTYKGWGHLFVGMGGVTDMGLTRDGVRVCRGGGPTGNL